MTAPAPAERDPMHLMTIEMGNWCGASGPGNGRASSAWCEVTCTECLAKGTAHLRALVWDMLQTMPPSREALAFAVRAGRLGVTDEQGRPLAMACTADEDPREGPPPFAALTPEEAALDAEGEDDEYRQAGIAATPGRPGDPYGGHVFHYEPHTDLFRCIRCHRYEVSARKDDGTVEPCAGEPPAGSGPIEVNAW